MVLAELVVTYPERLGPMSSKRLGAVNVTAYAFCRY